MEGAEVGRLGEGWWGIRVPQVAGRWPSCFGVPWGKPLDGHFFSYKWHTHSKTWTSHAELPWLKFC